MLKPISWIGSSKRDLLNFPEDIVDGMGHALWIVLSGETPNNAKPLKGFGGASVMELVDDGEDSTFRVVYTTKFSGFVYVLHAFRKKARKGIETPKHEMDVIEQRLKTVGANGGTRG